jgi:hypothetical protein
MHAPLAIGTGGIIAVLVMFGIAIGAIVVLIRMK